MASRAGYLQHLRTHSNHAAGDAKPYKCDECPASYTQVGTIATVHSTPAWQPSIATLHNNYAAGYGKPCMATSAPTIRQFIATIGDSFSNFDYRSYICGNRFLFCHIFSK